MTLQEQVEQFVEDYWKWDDDYKDTTLYLDTRILLRSVVEEVCRHAKGDIEVNAYVLANEADALCDSIRRHFAWLEK